MTAGIEERRALRAGGGSRGLPTLHDAAEQAADALTQAMDMFPDNVDWPIEFQEIRLMSDAGYAGQTIRHIPLQSDTGRLYSGGQPGRTVHYEPGPDFQIYPGDRLILMGPPEGLEQAEALLNQTENLGAANKLERFVIVELEVFTDSKWLGKTLADLQFRQRCGVTVVGIRRGQERITSPGPNESLQAGDRLIVIGTSDKISQLKCGALGVTIPSALGRFVLWSCQLPSAHARMPSRRPPPVRAIRTRVWPNHQARGISCQNIFRFSR